jgi:short-subunit dehydrogenase
MFTYHGTHHATYQGKIALVTGASSGIGAEFARQLAARGSGLVLVARSRAALEALASELAVRHGVRAEVVVADLAEEGAAGRVADEVAARGLRVDVLVNNAGFGTHGLFHTLPASRERDEIAVNVQALVDLTHAFLPAMLERRSGAVVNVASTAAFQPDPYMAVYGATKAFVLSFSHALHAETRRAGVRVVALCPGATETAFFDVVGSPHARVGRPARPKDVVAAGLRAVERNRAQVIPGLANALLALGPRFTTRAFSARVAIRLLGPPAGARPAAAQLGGRPG